MRELPVTAAGHIDRALHAGLAAELRSERTLGEVLAWGRRQTPVRTVTEIVTQDEYTHDVIMALDAPHYLVFDTT